MPVPDVSLERYATISAELGINEDNRAPVLSAHGLTDPAWVAIDKRWAAAIVKETERGERALLTSFDATYVATQERLGRKIGVAEYAHILVGIERGVIGAVFTELNLKLSDLMCAQRVWAQRTSEDAALSAQIQSAVAALRKGK